MKTFYVGRGATAWADTWRKLCNALYDFGEAVDTGHWQGLKNVPNTVTRELEYVNIEIDVPHNPTAWGDYLSGPNHLNSAWAEEHFLERVSGEPMNPGKAYKRWPWYRGNVETHRKPQTAYQGFSNIMSGVDPEIFPEPQFSHSYMERFWPCFAGRMDAFPEERHFGIRYRYGDLDDLLQLLLDEPTTRQAYLPIWFPEDLAATQESERVPCTLGYHFMMREGRLNCLYPMRSVDMFRYLTDDIYMAGRLMQWICTELGGRSDLWSDIEPGTLEFVASSVHVFAGDIPKLKKIVESP